MSVGIVALPRRVIPRWRDFQTTVSLGECGSVMPALAKQEPTSDFHHLLALWGKHKNHEIAGEILSESIVSNRPDLAQGVAKFISENAKNASPLALQVAQGILDSPDQPTKTVRLKSVAGNRSRISSLRRILRSQPYDPIGWCELARIHIIQGQTEKARRAILTAYSLGSQSRYILRATARCLLHLKETDTALKLLSQSPLVKRDPWVASAAISLSTILERRIPNLKEAINLAGNTNIPGFHRAELLAAIATYYLHEGSERRAKKGLLQALDFPTENVIAQALWAFINNRITLDIPVQLLENRFTFEANTFASAGNGQWESALRSSHEWVEDEEFAGRPVIEAAFIRTSAFDDFDGAAKLLTGAILTNPNDQLIINNIAFSLASMGDTHGAKEWMRKVDSGVATEIDRICITATAGLIEFRDGNYEQGRDYYKEASKLAITAKHSFLRASAAYHLAIEERRIKSAHMSASENDAIALLEKIKIPLAELLLKKLKSGPLLLPDNLKIPEVET